MKVLGYTRAHEINEFAIRELERAEPSLRTNDVLVDVKAISINPVDYKVRRSRSGADGSPVVLGWDAAGVVKQVGSAVTAFRPGDEVYYAGDLLRDGSYAERQTVDSRIIARKPGGLSFGEAAALPLTALTAWEGLFERGITYTDRTNVLIIGGAGGVGSVATQLLKAKTPARVIVTASRVETRDWCRQMGADEIIDHREDLSRELSRVGVESVDVVYGTTHTEKYLGVIPKLLRPFGHFILIDDPATLDIAPFKGKALSIHWELMFAKTLNDYALASQGEILAEVGRLVETGKVRPAVGLVLKGFRPENIRRGHEIVEASQAIGKVVVEF